MIISRIFSIFRIYLKIWLPVTVLTFLALVLVISGINFIRSLYDFIIGNPFDIIGVIIAIGWLSSLAWGFIAYQNRAALSVSESAGATKKQGSLYKIKEVRTNALKNISASAYNHESRQVIERFNPTPKEPQQPKQENEPDASNQSSNISNKFSNSGEKKEENSNDAVNEQQQNKESNKQSSVVPAKEPVKETANLAAINTAIKGESYATPLELDKYKERLRKLKQKRSKPENATSE